MLAHADRQAGELIEKYRSYARYQQRAYHGEWFRALQAFECNRDPEKDWEGKDDLTQTSMGLPDTWGYVRRVVARTTAQLPNLRYKCEDDLREQNIGHHLMWQWDKAGIQKQQKRHVQQAAILGWSPRGWSWEKRRVRRSRRVDPNNPASWSDIEETYNVPLKAIAAQIQQAVTAGAVDPSTGPQMISELITELMVKHGRGGLLPIRYDYLAYEGPKAEFILACDVFPNPDEDDIQVGGLITRRLRSQEWIEAQIELYRDDARTAKVAQGFYDLLLKHKQGTQRRRDEMDADLVDFRNLMERAYGRPVQPPRDHHTNYSQPEPLWLITEEHVPGSNPRLRIVGEDDVWIGEVPYPYDLEGKIAFTDARLIPDLFGPVGDSVPRRLWAVQEAKNRLFSRRIDLVDTMLRPLIGTNDPHLYNNPDALKRYGGYRLVQMRGGQGSMWQMQESAAQAAVIAGLNEESAIVRNWQIGSGESNMTMGADVDPQQNRTATGAKISAFNTDILTNDLVATLTESIRADAEMMFLLNRSEMSFDTPRRFDRTPYARKPTAAEQAESGYDPKRKEWVEISPLDLQLDGEVVVEAGSMLADDDEGRKQRAMTLVQLFGNRPNVNQDKVRDEGLIALGYASRLSEFAVPPPPPQPPPPILRSNLSFSGQDIATIATVDPVLARSMLQAAQLLPEQQPPPGAPGPQGPPQGPPPMPGMGGGVPGIPAMAPPPQPDEELSAFEAAAG